MADVEESLMLGFDVELMSPSIDEMSILQSLIYSKSTRSEADESGSTFHQTKRRVRSRL